MVEVTESSVIDSVVIEEEPEEPPKNEKKKPSMGRLFVRSVRQRFQRKRRGSNSTHLSESARGLGDSRRVAFSDDLQLHEFERTENKNLVWYNMDEMETMRKNAHETAELAEMTLNLGFDIESQKLTCWGLERMMQHRLERKRSMGRRLMLDLLYHEQVYQRRCKDFDMDKIAAAVSGLSVKSEMRAQRLAQSQSEDSILQVYLKDVRLALKTTSPNPPKAVVGGGILKVAHTKNSSKNGIFRILRANFSSPAA